MRVKSLFVEILTSSPFEIKTVLIRKRLTSSGILFEQDNGIVCQSRNVLMNSV